ncbi:MAG TPA: 30S ribosomal protein S20 [Candidatus Binataceae bacterium]|nr:30S ribosomal protein S20 [Candidatus Binataceae bacterium]
MPHVPVHPSAIKRHRRSLKRKLRNRAVKTHVHSAVKNAQEAVGSGDAERSARALQEAMKVLGKAATKGVIHRNTASRKISRLALALNRVKAQAASG